MLTDIATRRQPAQIPSIICDLTAPEIVTFGSDCSGMDVAAIAIRDVVGPRRFHQLFASDNGTTHHGFITHNTGLHPCNIHADIFTRPRPRGLSMFMPLAFRASRGAVQARAAAWMTRAEWSSPKS